MTTSTTATPSLDRRETPGALEAARAAFDRVPGHLDAASAGLPPRTVQAALRGALDEWAAGRATPAGYDEAVRRSRSAYAGLVGVEADRVAVGSQVSVAAGLVAAALPDGAEVVCVDGDFSSMVHPFLVHADRGVTVRHVPLDGLAEALRPSTTLVAFSLAQSACGSLADAVAVREAAARHDVLTFCDLTQAAGWMPVDAGGFDLTVCSAYKWLCAPRGSAFLTVAPRLEERFPLRPLHAGWYAGESVWDSCYGPGMELAHSARRYDVSPAWMPWVGTVPALELFGSVPAEDVRRWDAGLADRVREALDLPPAGRAVVSLDDPDGTLRSRLLDAGARVAGRAGRVRLAFHLWNDEDDVDLVVRTLTRR
ncbi:aminotransferase class V-fold PLP-dependent enzyme [Thalassiella azotivora]